MCFPFFFVIDDVLAIWLKQVPDYAGSFVFLILLYSLVNSLNQPIWTLAQAVGKLRGYICIGSAVFLLAFPISYILLRQGFSPNAVFETNVIVRVFYLITVFVIIRKYIPVSIYRYFKETLLPIFLVCIVSVIPVMALGIYISNMAYNHWILCGFAFLWNIAVIYFCGLSKNERVLVKSKILNRINR